MVKNSAKKIFTMYGASVLGILLGFLISVFNSRALGPEDFGDFKFIETVARFIASIVSVGFFISLTRLVAMNEDKNREKKYVGLFTTIFGIASAIGIVLYLGFSLIEPHFFDNDLKNSISRYFFIVMVIIGQTAIGEILKGLHKIYTLSFLSVIPLIAYLTIAYVLDQFIEVDIDFVLFTLYGITFLTVAVMLFRLNPDFKIPKVMIKELFKENRFNGRPIYFGSLAGVATTHIAGFSISFFMNNTQVGFFMLALTICTPLLVIPSVLGTIFYKQFVNMRTIPNKVFYFSGLSTILALIVFYSIIEFVVITFYTEAYLPVADIAKFLIIAFIFHGLGDLINRFLGAKGEGKLLRNAAFLVGIVNVLGYTILIKFFDLNGAIITKILASGLYLAVMFMYYFNFIKKNKDVQG